MKATLFVNWGKFPYFDALFLFFFREHKVLLSPSGSKQAICQIFSHQPCEQGLGGMFDLVFINNSINTEASWWLGSSKGFYISGLALIMHISSPSSSTRCFNGDVTTDYFTFSDAFTVRQCWCLLTFQPPHQGFSAGPGLSMLSISLKLVPLLEQINCSLLL